MSAGARRHRVARPRVGAGMVGPEAAALLVGLGMSPAKAAMCAGIYEADLPPPPAWTEAERRAAADRLVVAVIPRRRVSERRPRGDGPLYAIHLDGVRLSGGQRAIHQIEHQIEGWRAMARRRVRKCMTCPARFESEGPHNRMCGRCRGEGPPDGGADWFAGGLINA